MENVEKIIDAIDEKTDISVNNPSSIYKPIIEAQKETTEAIKEIKISPQKDNIKVSLDGVSVIAIKGDKGDPGLNGINGKDGYTPKKFKDYFTKEEIEQIIKRIQKSIRIPKDGKDGKNGYTPVSGEDYPTYSEIKKQVEEAVALLPTPKDGKIPNHEWNKDKTRIRFETPDGEWGEWSDVLKGKDGKTTFFGGGINNFIELNDAPNHYTGEAGKILKVNSAENGLEFVTPQSIEDVNWGEISGTLDNQTDLKSALDLKANSADLSIVATSGSHEDLTNLDVDDHKQYALLAGRSGGQTLIGGSGITDILKLQGTSGNGTLNSPAIKALVGNNGATTAFTVLNNGNVGIGTTAPSAKLHVNGKLYIGSSPGVLINYYDFLVEKSDLAAAFITDLPTSAVSGRAFAVGVTGENNVRTLFYSNGFIGFGPGSSTRDTFIGRSDTNTLRIGSSYDGTGNGNLIVNGNIGIGTTSPTAYLNIKAGTATAGTAPLKFTTGVVNTTPEAGTMEYNNTFHLTNSDATRRHIVTAPNTTKVTASAPYTNDGYVTVNIGGTDFKVMTTA
jgi:hypothetical protein